jgi:hypothetical protein
VTCFEALEEFRTLVLRQVLEAQQRGERLSDAAIAEYLKQLTQAEADT